MKCRNCGHPIARFYDTKWGENWLHVSHLCNREGFIIEMTGTPRCGWSDEKECKTCHNISFVKPCECHNPMPITEVKGATKPKGDEG